MAEITCSSFVQRNGRYILTCGKQSWEFGSLRAIRERVAELESKETLFTLALGLWLKRNPTGSNPSLMNGRTLTIDLGAAGLPATLLTLS